MFVGDLASATTRLVRAGWKSLTLSSLQTACMWSVTVAQLVGRCGFGFSLIVEWSVASSGMSPTKIGVL